jgi:hypothetical protein
VHVEEEMEMRPRFVVWRDVDGAPKTAVPRMYLWELIEYLSLQRVEVLYRYEATEFFVNFPRLTETSAQRILDDWARACEVAA